MATVAIPGRKAYIRFSTASSATTAQSLVQELQDFTLTVNTADIVLTNHDSSGWEERMDGIKGAEWEATLNYVSTGVQGTMRQSLLDGDANQYVTFQATTAAASKKYQFKTRLRSFTQSNPTDGQVAGTIRGQSHGAITRTA